MTQLTGNLLKRALANPYEADGDVRGVCGVPDDRYYEMSVWPVSGLVTVSKRVRDKPCLKISKSSQK